MSDAEQRRFDHQPSDGWEESSSLRSDPLRQALHAVPVPVGLDWRLLESVALSNSPAIGVKDPLQGNADPKAIRTVSARKPRLLSRRMWLAAGLAAGCGGVALGGYGWLRRPLLEHVVRKEALDWPQRLNNVGWYRVNGAPMPVDHIRIPRGMQVQNWRYLDTPFSSRTVVYELNGARAYLFAIKTRRNLALLPREPPNLPPKGTGEWIVVTWQSAGCLYVVALHNTAEHLYRELLHAQSSGLV